MSLPEVLVSAKAPTGDTVLLLLNLESGAWKSLLHHWCNFATLHSTQDQLYVVQSEIADTVCVRRYDQSGLVGLHRVDDCCDTHGMTRVGDELAICSTGTNEIIILDDLATELRRWTPDTRAEGDSWHLNSLASHQDRLWTTCFGGFDVFRGWNGQMEGRGLLLDVDSGRPVLSGLSAPHDPRPLDGGWLLNEAVKARTMFFPAKGKPEVVAQFESFTRGLVILPEAYVIGISGHRHVKGPSDGAAVHIVDRGTRAALKTIPLPFREIAHIMSAPRPELLAALGKDPRSLSYRYPPSCHLIPIYEANRAGSIKAVSLLKETTSGEYEVLIRVTNQSRMTWASNCRFYLFISYEIVDEAQNVIFTGARTGLPVPLLPGKSLTFPILINPTASHYVKGARTVRISFLQQCIGWWDETPLWRPAVLELPRPACSQEGPSQSRTDSGASHPAYSPPHQAERRASLKTDAHSELTSSD